MPAARRAAASPCASPTAAIQPRPAYAIPTYRQVVKTPGCRVPDLRLHPRRQKRPPGHAAAEEQTEAGPPSRRLCGDARLHLAGEGQQAWPGDDRLGALHAGADRERHTRALGVIQLEANQRPAAERAAFRLHRDPVIRQRVSGPNKGNAGCRSVVLAPGGTESHRRLATLS